MDPICTEKGSLWATLKMKKTFWAEITKANHQLPENFILSKYHLFWLSYESFSILSDIFCQKSAISSKNSCEKNFDGKWMMTVHNCIKVKLLCYGRINEAFHCFLQLGNMYFSSWDMSFFVTSVLQKICQSNFWNIQNEQVLTKGACVAYFFIL